MLIAFVTFGRLKARPWLPASIRMPISLPSTSCSSWKLANFLSRLAAEVASCALSGLDTWTT